MQYAMPKKTELDSKFGPRDLADWCKLQSDAIAKVKDLEQSVSYAAAVKFARSIITALKETTENFAERSFVLALRPHINPQDLGYNW